MKPEELTFVIWSATHQILDRITPLPWNAVNEKGGHGHAQAGLNNASTPIRQKQIQDAFSQCLEL